MEKFKIGELVEGTPYGLEYSERARIVDVVERTDGYWYTGETMDGASYGFREIDLKSLYETDRLIAEYKRQGILPTDSADRRLEAESPKPVDPKQAAAIKKMVFNAVPISLLVHAVPGNTNGADKYGIWNWLKLEDGTMSLNTYINALQRHLLLFRAGQDRTSDTDIHNLDSMIAGLAVVRDAMLFGKVIDDRVKLSDEQIVILEKVLNNEERT